MSCSIDSCRDNRQWGFTLVEVLVSISIMMLIAPLAIEGVRTGLETWNRLEQRADVMDRARTAQRVIRKQISQALPYKVNDDAQESVYFHGSRTGVEFVANLPGHISGGGLFLNKIQGAEIDDEPVLLLSYSPFGGIGGDDPYIERTVLGKGLEKIEFAYFGSTNIREQASWHDRWDNQAQLPQRVRLRVVREKSNDPRWSELIIPVYASPRQL